MAIHRLYLANFKGVAQEQWIDLKPITVFIGANSSGKSSCIHALACLSQTVKVTNNSRPLILDDEFANVHLGRFIEVVHTRSYQDIIGLGMALQGVQVVLLDQEEIKRGAKLTTVDANAVYRFKCTRRTQDVHLDSMRAQVGDLTYTAKREGHQYNLARSPDFKCRVLLESAFFFDPSSLYVYPDNFSQTYPLIQFQSTLTTELSKTLYLGPFRQAPQRKYETRGSSPTEVGSMGESTATLLANEIVQTRTRTHISQIAKWLRQLGLAKDLDVERLARSDLFDVNMTLDDGKKFPLADLGYGLSQVLPVLTQCSFAPEGCTLLFEQPEIHLHTIAARELASVFIETASTKKCHVIVETHSPDLVKQFFRKINDGDLSADDFVVYRVSRRNECSVITPIEIDVEDGQIDIYENWEAGISIP